MFKIRCLYSLVWDGSWDGREWPWFSFNKTGKLCKKSRILLAIQQAYMRKLLDGTKKKSNSIFEWYPSLFLKWYKLRNICFIEKALWWSPTDHQRKQPSCRQAPERFQLKAVRHFSRAFRRALCRNNHTGENILYWWKRARKGGTPSTSLKNLYFLCRQSAEPIWHQARKH